MIHHFDCDTARLQIHRLNRNWLINFFHFPILWIEFPIRSDDALDAKNSEIRFIAKVAAVSDELRSVWSDLAQALIAPFPNETAEQSRIGINFIPVFLQVANRVAHRVRVFACEYRERIV